MKNLLMNHDADSVTQYVVVIGDSAMDVMASASMPLRSYVPCKCDGILQKRGGCARNVAENLARLGCETKLISVIGDDIPGRSLIDLTAHAGVDLSASRISQDKMTAACLIINDNHGEHFCMISDYSITDELSPEWLKTQSTIIQNANLIIANTILSEESLLWLFAQNGGPVFIDTVVVHHAERIRPWLPKVHTIKCSRSEAHLLANLPFSSREHAPAVADWFHQQGVAQVILSLGEFGVYYSNGEQQDWMKPISINVVDVTGAGDALIAGLAYGWLNALPFVDTVRFSIGCAAMTLNCSENNHPELSRDAVMGLI